ncbi:MAG: hypothetical protein ACKOCB_00185 [Planctomycetia bacterium]
MRCLPALRAGLLACGVLLAASCGQPASSLEVEVRTFGADGAAPAGLRLQRVQGGRAVGEPLPVEPIAGTTGRYRVPPTEPGSYELLTPPGWGSLAGGALPQLVPGASPAQYVIARHHALVALSMDPRHVLGEEWALEVASTAMGVAQRAALGVERDASGAVLLRVPEAAWGKDVALQARYEDGSVSECWRATLPASGVPGYVLLKPPERRSLALRVAGAPEEHGPVEVLAQLEGWPLSMHARATLAAGRAVLEGLPLGARALRACLQPLAGPTAPAAACVTLPAAQWEVLQEACLLHPAWQGEGARMLRLRGVPAQAGLRVQVAPWASDAYGLAVLEADAGGEVRLRLRPGRHALLVEGAALAGGAAGVRAAQVEVLAGEGEQVVDLPLAQEPARVAGQAYVPAGSTVLWQRVEEGRVRALHGGALRTAHGGRYEATLPPGQWQVEVHVADGPSLPPRRMELTPGLRLSLSLQR